MHSHSRMHTCGDARTQICPQLSDSHTHTDGRLIRSHLYVWTHAAHLLGAGPLWPDPLDEYRPWAGKGPHVWSPGESWWLVLGPLEVLQPVGLSQGFGQDRLPTWQRQDSTLGLPGHWVLHFPGSLLASPSKQPSLPQGQQHGLGQKAQSGCQQHSRCGPQPK